MYKIHQREYIGVKSNFQNITKLVIFNKKQKIYNTILVREIGLFYVRQKKIKKL